MSSSSWGSRSLSSSARSCVELDAALVAPGRHRVGRIAASSGAGRSDDRGWVEPRRQARSMSAAQLARRSRSARRGRAACGSRRCVRMPSTVTRSRRLEVCRSVEHGVRSVEPRSVRARTTCGRAGGGARRPVSSQAALACARSGVQWRSVATRSADDGVDGAPATTKTSRRTAEPAPGADPDADLSVGQTGRVGIARG